MNDYKLIQTKGVSPNETNHTRGCEWTLYKNGNVFRIFDEYSEAIREYKRLAE